MQECGDRHAKHSSRYGCLVCEVISALQCRLARTGTGLGVRETALLAGVSPETITRIEKNGSVKPATIERVVAVFGFLGVDFINDNERPGLIIDLERLSAVRSGGHDAEFATLHEGPVRARVNMLGAFLRKMGNQLGP